MSSTTPNPSHSPRLQYEQLLLKATALANTLARRRADVALLRAESATMAVSLESAKEQLDELLRHEILIRNRAIAQRASPTATALHPGDAMRPDPGLLQSLKGQLEVTRASVGVAEEKKRVLVAEIEALEKGEEHLGEEHQGDGDINKGIEGIHIVWEDGGKGEKAGGGGAEVEGFTVGKERQVRGPLDAAAVKALREGIESKSAFRLDHARIWRDVTMPNLALIRKSHDKLIQPEVTLGVAIERIFEGVTCFQPTHAQRDSAHTPRDLRIDPAENVRRPSDDIIELVSKRFGVLTVCPREDTHKLRILAPTVALQRIMDLITREDKDKQKRPRPQLLVETEAAPDTTPDDKHHTETTSATTQIPSPRRRRSHESQVTVSVKLIDPSHVLHKEHFSQIMAQGVPIRFHESALQLIYSTNLHGMSLNTLFNRVKATSPTLVCIRDTKDRMFGCYAASPWKSSATRYYGTGESFVFGTDGPQVAKVYKWSRANSFFQFTSSNFLAIGGGAGSHFALWIDEDLLMGTTSACSTFASPPLTNIADEEVPNTMEFKIVALEVWGFNAHRRH